MKVRSLLIVSLFAISAAGCSKELSKPAEFLQPKTVSFTLKVNKITSIKPTELSFDDLYFSIKNIDDHRDPDTYPQARLSNHLVVEDSAQSKGANTLKLIHTYSPQPSVMIQPIIKVLADKTAGPFVLSKNLLLPDESSENEESYVGYKIQLMDHDCWLGNADDAIGSPVYFLITDKEFIWLHAGVITPGKFGKPFTVDLKDMKGKGEYKVEFSVDDPAVVDKS